MAKISINFDRKKIILHEEVSPKELEQLIASISLFPLETNSKEVKSFEQLKEKINKQVTQCNNITWSGGPFNPELLKPDSNPKVNITFGDNSKSIGVRPYITMYGEQLDD